MSLDPHCHAAQLLKVGESPFTLESDGSEFTHEFEKLAPNPKNPKAFAAHLKTIKRLAAVTYMNALAGPLNDTPEECRKLGAFWSHFADWTLEQALRAAVAQPAIAKRLDLTNSNNGEIPGLFILGLGKLGGNDLNYSSDVDLVCFFDTDQFSVARGEGKTDIANRLMKEMTRILSGALGAQIWRVDWRLRPDPSVTGLAMSVSAGLDFHFFHAAPWRRLAMMKARVVAGDKKAAEAFLKELTPFLWRRALDFRAIEEISDLKERIRNEHPGLEDQRTDDQPLTTLSGFNVKLGMGGIREIEFIANAQQLVWGGRNSPLRTTNTLEALERLGELGHLNSDTVDQMRNAYALLRGLENRIQLVQDAHTHLIPSHADDQNLLLQLADGISFATLEKQIRPIRKTIHETFLKTFTTELDSSNVEILDSEKPVGLNEAAEKTLKGWSEGFINYGISPGSAGRMRSLYKSILKILDKSKDATANIIALNEFFLSLPPGGQYLTLLAENPQLAEDILPPLIGNGAMANLLRLSPHVVDLLVQRRGNTQTNKGQRLELSETVFTQRDYESSLETMRGLVNEMLYLAYLAAWRQETSPNETRKLLTSIAEESLQFTEQLVRAEYPKLNAGLSIAGFGKLGMEQMMPESDLDIIYFAHGEETSNLEDVDLAHKLSNRLTTALSTQMRGGRVYEIDTRLKPSGASGAPTVRLSTFYNHQMERAATWEHFALVTARMVLGPDFAKKAFSEVRKEVITRKRDKTAFLDESRAMLSLLQQHRIQQPQKGTIAVKLMPGGLMELEYLISYLVLKLGPDHPQLTETNYRNLPAKIEEVYQTVSGLNETLNFLLDVHFYERLYGWTDKPVGAQELTQTGWDYDEKALFKKLTNTQTCIREWLEAEGLQPLGKKSRSKSGFERKPVSWVD